MWMKADILGCSSNLGLMLHICVGVICVYIHTHAYHTHMEREGEKEKNSEEKIIFHIYNYFHKQTQIQKERTENKPIISQRKMIQVLSILQKQALSLDYLIIPTLLFSPGMHLKLCQSFHLQVKLDGFITWHNFQTPQLSLQPFWLHGKFTRLTFSYMTEFSIRINKMINLLFFSPLSLRFPPGVMVGHRREQNI